MHCAAAALQSQGLGAVIQRLKVRESSQDRRAWDGLMAAAQNGNTSAYRRLLSEVAVWLKGFYARRLPPAMVDDTIQETLIAIHEKRHTYDPTRPFGSWLAAIARYKWIDALRSLKARPTEALSSDVPVPGHEDPLIDAWSLEQLLNTLKPAQSRVIRLVKLEGHSIEEASRMTGQSAALVKVNIHRGLKRLISLLRGEPDAE